MLVAPWHRVRLLVCVLSWLGWAATANAQPPVLAPQSPVETPRPVVIETTTPAWVLMDMPSSGTLYSLLETVNPEVISNRIEGGGMYPSSPAHIGAHGSSWTQTLFRVGDINITDPDGSGTPLVFPGVLEWERVDVNTGMMGVEVNAPGMVLNLAPRRPSSTWIRQFEAMAGPPELQAGGVVPSPPTIAHLQRYGHASVLLSGPLSERLGIVFTGNYSRATRLDRANPTQLDSGLASAFTHLVYTPSPRDEVRSVFWFQRALTPVDHPLIFQEPDAQERTTSMSLQSTWERRGSAGRPSWRAFAAVSARDRAQSAGRQTVLSIERLDEPPPWEQLDPGPGRNRTWQLGARMRQQPLTAFNLQHDVTAGVDLSGGVASQDTWFNGRIGELVNGIPARIWEFTAPGAKSGWQQTTIAAYAGDSFALRPRLNVTAGLRFEHIAASADGGETPVSWTDLFPRLGVRWDITADARLHWFLDYGRYGYNMRLRDLAYGDPSAPTANVYRWNAPIGTTVPEASAKGPLVERWGPGTGGTPGFSAVDPDLNRPNMNEMVVGFQFRPAPSWVTRIAGIARLDKSLLAVSNVGVPFSTYTRTHVIDPGVDIVGGTTTQPLPIYNRSVSTFGADRYLLTNNPDITSTFTGFDITAQVTKEKLFVLIGGTAGRSGGWASNRGFRYNENDIAVLGEVFADPNANTFAKARVFTERGYTLHVSGAYHFGHDIRLGLATRYQDGQHFARMVVAPDLNQGADLVRAFGNGETRFKFTGTLDTRLQKGFVRPGYRIDVLLDVFNTFNMVYEVEEVTVSGPTSRDTSAIQPPRSLHVGVRVSF
jgi:TonB dependent receptor-like, beta-barrel